MTILDFLRLDVSECFYVSTPVHSFDHQRQWESRREGNRLQLLTIEACISMFPVEAEGRAEWQPAFCSWLLYYKWESTCNSFYDAATRASLWWITVIESSINADLCFISNPRRCFMPKAYPRQRTWLSPQASAEIPQYRPVLKKKRHTQWERPTHPQLESSLPHHN